MDEYEPYKPSPLHEALSKAQDRAMYWKWAFWTVALTLLWVVLEMHGCLPHGNYDQPYP